MDAKSISPFLEAIATVMPQLGFEKVERGRLSLDKTNKIENKGVMVVVGLTHQLRGNIAYNMTVESAKSIASKMMMGMPVETFDAMAESAIAELGNMLTANAAMIFEKQGSQIDISPPTVITGTAYASTTNSQSLVVEVKVDGIPLIVNVSIA
jgi:chemotaxis protein CheX